MTVSLLLELGDVETFSLSKVLFRSCGTLLLLLLLVSNKLSDEVLSLS